MGSIVNSIIGGVTGNTGGAGANYQAGGANLLNPTTVDQANQAQQQAQTALAQQQAFLQAVQGQNGLQNQSSVFNQQQGIVNGTGPNPAQAQLAQATGANVANQAALMAGQRGSGANPGLVARQAAMQGANIQQQAAGQAATLQANQSLNALNQQSGIANQQAGQLQQATATNTNANLAAQQNILGGINNQNQASVGNLASQNAANAGVAKQVAAGQSSLLGNVMGGLGSATNLIGNGLSSLFGGGSTLGTIGGGIGEGLQAGGAADAVGGAAVAGEEAAPLLLAATGGKVPSSMYGKQIHNKKMATGGKVPALVSPGEQYLDPKQASEVASGKAAALKTGEKIPGTPKVGGAKNSYANDTVSKTLEAGGIVIPRSVTQSKDAEKKAQAFVKAHFARSKSRGL